MTVQIMELYSDSDMSRLGRKVSVWTRTLCGVAAAALAACVIMAATANTANAGRMELGAVATSTVAGWFVIYCGIFVVSRAKRELAHAKMLKQETRERVEGTVTVTRERLAIRKSIIALRVDVAGSAGTKRVLVTEQKGEALAKAAAAGVSAVYTAHGYVAAYEVTV